MPLGLAFRDRAEVELPMRGVAPAFRFLTLDERLQRASVEVRRRILAEQVEQCRHYVHRFGEAVDAGAGRYCPARVADDQRNVVAAVEITALAEHEMVRPSSRHVGGQHDDGVVPRASGP